MSRIPLPTPELVRKYAAGASLRELAREYEVSKETILRRLKAAGVGRRPCHPNVPVLRELVRRHGDALVRGYRHGKSLRELSRDYGISVDAVRRLLLARGVSLRSTSAAMRVRRRHTGRTPSS